MTPSITLSWELSALVAPVALFLLRLIGIVALYSWLRGDTMLPGELIPASPLFIVTRRRALMISLALEVISFYFFPFQPYSWMHHLFVSRTQGKWIRVIICRLLARIATNPVTIPSYIAPFSKSWFDMPRYQGWNWPIREDVFFHATCRY